MRNLLIGTLALIVLTILTGFVYPALVTGVAQLAFPAQANGSLLVDGTGVRGSALLGQKFDGDRWFHGRPSAADYVVLSSAASNLGPGSQDLAAAVAKRRADWQAAYPGQPIPAEMSYASASGLDPDISLEAALIQVDRVAKARGWSQDRANELRDLIRTRAAKESGSLSSIVHINVTMLNWTIDQTWGGPAGR